MKKKQADRRFLPLFLMALAVFCYAAVRLGLIFMEYYQGQQEYGKLAETVLKGQQQAGRPQSIQIDFEGLKQINKDVLGWIRFENLDINYPIVQSKDNEYYLSHSFYKEEMKCGSIFMEAQNTPDFSDDNTFIYGHNMKDKSMFAKLNQFQDKAVYDENPEFFIYREDGIYKYRIFACYAADVEWDSFLYQFADKKQYGAWQKTIKGRSNYDTGFLPKQEQKTVTLMTCTPAGENYRFLVHGALEEKIDNKK